jgi:hypothetical protein
MVRQRWVNRVVRYPRYVYIYGICIHGMIGLPAGWQTVNTNILKYSQLLQASSTTNSCDVNIGD